MIIEKKDYDLIDKYSNCYKKEIKKENLLTKFKCTLNKYSITIINFIKNKT